MKLTLHGVPMPNMYLCPISLPPRSKRQKRQFSEDITNSSPSLDVQKNM